jgi:tetratricopeptide (TPR) repeat protein
MYQSRSLIRRLIEILLCANLFFSIPAQAAQPAKIKWIRVSSDHFSVLSNADEKKAREVAVRLEQMRGVFGQLLFKRKLNMSEPLDVIALRSDKEYADVAPIRQGQPTFAPGFFLSGQDRNYIVLNLFEPESWLAVSHQFAHLFLTYNYPPTQPWFDEGFAEYFSSLRLVGNQAQIGADPELGVTWDEDILGDPLQKRNPRKSLTELLTAPVWLATPDLFTMHDYVSGYQEGTHHSLFYAQSWMVVHYLLNKNKLPETGTYFDLVQNQKVSVPDAIQQAYGMSVAQFDQAVKDYFNSLAPLFLALDASKLPDTKSFDLNSPVYQVSHFATTQDAENIGTSTAQISDAEAQATVAEMAARLPEHRQQATAQLQAIIDDPKTENAIAHRALAWVHIQKKEYDQADAELTEAAQIDPKDPWVRYYSALMKYQQAQLKGQIPGIANMMQDLRAVIDWNPDFAEAYNMLAMSRLQGGGNNSAMDAMRPAIQLSPRSETYLLNLVRIYFALKKWDEATALLDRLKVSQNPQVAHAARKDLEDLPTLKKYGVLPQPEAPAPAVEASSKHPAAESKQKADDDSDSESSPALAADPKPDTRPIKFLKGTLISVDCSKPPAAVLTVSSAGTTLKLRTADYKSLLLIGTDAFSCEWQRQTVMVNYKADGKTSGDLVSLELQ